MAFVHGHHIWDVNKVKSLMADPSHPVSFFCGGSRNFHHFIGLFDRVFVLDIDLVTLKRRLAGRPDDEFEEEPPSRPGRATACHEGGHSDERDPHRCDDAARFGCRRYSIEMRRDRLVVPLFMEKLNRSIFLFSHSGTQNRYALLLELL